MKNLERRVCLNFLNNFTEEEKRKLKVVRYFVKKERMKMGVIDKDLKLTGRPELSCYAKGEFKNLLYRQLIYTRFGYGSWIGLRGDVLDGLLSYIEKVKNFREQ